MISLGEVMSPTTRALAVSRTLCEAWMVPTTTPATTSARTSTSAWTMPPSSTVSVWLSWTLPSIRPRTTRSSSPRTSPAMRVSGPITVSPLLLLASAMLHVHVDVALERGSVGDHDARRFDVADHLGFCAQLDALAGQHVAGEASADGQRLSLDVGFHRRAVLHGEILGNRDLSLDRPEDGQRLLAADLPIDDDTASDDGVAHGLVLVLRHVGWSGSARVSNAGRQLDVHVHGPGKPGPLFYHQPRGADIAHHPRRRVEHRGAAGHQIAAHLALEGGIGHLQVGLDDARLLDGEPVVQRYPSLDAALDHQILVAGDLTSNRDLAANEAGLFVRHLAAPSWARGPHHDVSPRESGVS